MKDELDKNTEDLALTVELDGNPPVPKKRGRPPRQITSRNFFDIRNHLERKFRYPNNTGSAAESFAEVAHQTFRAELTQSTIDKYIAEHRDALEVRESKWDRQRLESWEGKKPQLLTAEHIALLQDWVDGHLDKDDWTRMLNQIRVKKSKRGGNQYANNIRQISVKSDTFKELERVKEGLGAASWDSLLLRLARSVKTSQLKRRRC